MMPLLSLAGLFAFGYVCGSIPFGLILTRLAGLGDIRAIGSGNIGATNVLRTGNRTLAATTLLLDGAKGALAVFLSTELNFFLHNNTVPGLIAALAAGLGAVLGHMFPVWLKFRGGKGVATALGVFLAATPFVGLLACGTWVALAVSLRYSSLAALGAMALAPIAALFLYGPVHPAPLVVAGISALVWSRHTTNIRRLLNGQEPKIGSKTKSSADSTPPP